MSGTSGSPASSSSSGAGGKLSSDPDASDMMRAAGGVGGPCGGGGCGEAGRALGWNLGTGGTGGAGGGGGLKRPALRRLSPFSARRPKPGPKLARHGDPGIIVRWGLALASAEPGPGKLRESGGKKGAKAAAAWVGLRKFVCVPRVARTRLCPHRRVLPFCHLPLRATTWFLLGNPCRGRWLLKRVRILGQFNALG